MPLTLDLNSPQEGKTLIGIVRESMKDIGKPWKVHTQWDAEHVLVHIGYLPDQDEISFSRLPALVRTSGPIMVNRRSGKSAVFNQHAPFDVFHTGNRIFRKYSMTICLFRDDPDIKHIYTRQSTKTLGRTMSYLWELLPRKGKKMPINAFGVKDSIFTIIDPAENMSSLTFYANAAYKPYNPESAGRVESRDSPQFSKIEQAYSKLIENIKKRLPAQSPYRGIALPR